MKSASLFLSLIACGQTNQDIAPPPFPSLNDVGDSTNTPEQSTPQTAAPQNDFSIQITGADPELPPSSKSDQNPGSDRPILVCASSAQWTGMTHFDSADIAPELLHSVSRISVFETENGHSAVVETGSAHHPDELFGTVTHEEVFFHMEDDYIDLTWDNASIMGWRTQEYGSVFNGGGWGEIAAPITETTEPPPPCGFEIYISCWEPNNVQSPFNYDPKTGQCVDANQQVGLNYKPVEYIRETGDGECAELSWAMLSEGIPFDVEMKDWNLRGSKLEFASLGTPMHDEDLLPQHSLVNAQLEGADLSDLDATNAILTGRIDGHTQLPDMDCIIDDNDVVDCEI